MEIMTKHWGAHGGTHCAGKTIPVSQPIASRHSWNFEVSQVGWIAL